MHCVAAHARRVQKLDPWRFPQTDRSSSVSQFRCLTVYPSGQNTRGMSSDLVRGVSEEGIEELDDGNQFYEYTDEYRYRREVLDKQDREAKM
jgi:hypothetical protein